MGMSGVWSASGSFSNQRFGRFHAYASDMSRGVLLTWPDKKLLVTPEDSAQFIQSLGAAY
jgi:hypothetical protein